MFKEEEAGNKRNNIERSEESFSTNAYIVASACPFCNTMLMVGMKSAEKEDHVQVMDIAELIAASLEQENDPVQ